MRAWRLMASATEAARASRVTARVCIWVRSLARPSVRATAVRCAELAASDSWLVSRDRCSRRALRRSEASRATREAASTCMRSASTTLPASEAAMAAGPTMRSVSCRARRTSPPRARACLTAKAAAQMKPSGERARAASIARVMASSPSRPDLCWDPTAKATMPPAQSTDATAANT